MKPNINMTKIRISVSRGFSAVTPWRAGRVLTLGALLAAGTALYLNMTSEGEAGSPSSIEKMEVAPKFMKPSQNSAGCSAAVSASPPALHQIPVVPFPQLLLTDRSPIAPSPQQATDYRRLLLLLSALLQYQRTQPCAGSPGIPPPAEHELTTKDSCN